MKKQAALLSALLLSCSIPALAETHTVTMKTKGENGMMVFEPAVLKVELGDTVRFEPTDPGHNSETISGLIPAGAEGWKGAMGQAVEVTITQEGVYVYKCAPHLPMAMVGMIVAGKPVNLEQVISDAAAVKTQFFKNKKRLDNYLAQAE